MKTSLKLPLLLAALVVAGCATTPPPTVIQDHYVPVPGALMVKCDIAEPPDPIVFMGSSVADQQALLTTEIRADIASLQVCNARTARLQQWDARQQAIYTAPASGATGSK